MTTQQVLEGQKALVTGANSGIGAAIAKELATAGAEVAINYVTNPDATNRLIDEIESAGGRAIGIKADVSQEDQVQTMFREVIDTLGTLDILVNNAGLQRDAPVHEMTLRDWELVLGVNLTGQFLCSREAIKEFLRREVPRECSCSAGKIICVSSVHDRIPWAGHANYAASKGGVMLLMMTMAQELSRYKIRVNSISPGAIKTPINRAAWETPEKEAELLELIPYGRVGKVEDIANAAVWLASDASDYVTGATLYVDGGMTLYPGFREGG
ncbi:MAG TPA: SDR family oxidoreductase [Gammaproteobacteria bacterium]|nr:SDR family oxidoreductase [Gammaproteobacteria bacterium]